MPISMGTRPDATPQPFTRVRKACRGGGAGGAGQLLAVAARTRDRGPGVSADGDGSYGIDQVLIGVTIGTASSIYVASALALKLGMKREHLLQQKVEKEGADQPSILP